MEEFVIGVKMGTTSQGWIVKGPVKRRCKTLWVAVTLFCVAINYSTLAMETLKHTSGRRVQDVTSRAVLMA